MRAEAHLSDVVGTLSRMPSEFPRPICYVSFDPGTTTGVTLWDAQGKMLCTNELDIRNLNLFLDVLERYVFSGSGFKRLIVEEYRLYQSKAVQQSGSKLETVQVIGMIKRSNHTMMLEPVVEVRADNKDIAAKWSGVRIPKGHMPDWMSSYLIGYWWLHKVAGIIPARVLEELL